MGAREAITKLLMGKVGGPWEGGIRAYHSSPHDFDRFDWSKLRTGEGANTFGAGFYAAENPKVSGQGGEYWNQFLSRFPKQDMRTAEILKQHGFDREATIAELERQKEGAIRRAQGSPGDFHRDAIEMFQQKIDHLRSGAPVGPRTYEVNINARPELMLDWDKPLTQQSAGVQDFVRGTDLSHIKEGNRSRVLLEKFKAGAEQPEYPATGQVFYRGLSGHGDDTTRASEMLRDAGIPGIRYLDQGSRPNSGFGLQSLQGALQKAEATGNAAEAAALRGEIHSLQNPTYNYVVTDPSKLDILAKYGVVGTAGGGMGVLAAQDQYGAAP